MSNKELSPETAWNNLADHHKDWSNVHMKELFSQNPNRFEEFHIEHEGLVFDYSKNLIDKKTLDLLCDLAQQSGLAQAQADMPSGAKLNHTENRSVLHMALRGSVSADLNIDGENVLDFVQKLNAQIKSISDTIRSNTEITDVIHIGVGGSDLGPNVVCQALSHLQNGPKVHFINNIDGQTISALLATLSQKNTAILIASKTFTTLETCTNANCVKNWMLQELSAEQFSQHTYAMTSAAEEAEKFGIKTDHILPMRDWIGGRFSLWSSIGLPIAIALGYAEFQNLLAGAKTIDEHFINAPLHQNIPALMGVIGIWYRNIFDYHGHAILPYSDNLSLLPTYMQQLDMESNGKYSDKHKTAPLVFGGSGTCAQHAFMQALHQSTEITPCDFIIIAKNDNAQQEFQTALNANALAQSQALMLGKENESEPHRHFPGNRPSSTLVLPELNAKNLGMLLALYEHKTFTQGIIWNINSFDQWGVELGKTLAKDIITDLNAQTPSSSHDNSTQGLIRAILDKG